MMPTPSRHGYLVLGAGQLGMSVLRSLAPRLDASTPISVVESPQVVASNEPEHQARIAELENLGASIISLDLAGASKADLMEAFSPFETVLNCTGFVAGPGTQLRLTRAAIAGGVPRYVPWQFGVNYDLVRYSSPNDVFDEQYDVRLLLRAQKTTEWVIISTGMFTSFLFEPAFGIVDLEQKTVRALGSWETQVTCTTPEDIGRLTADIMLHQPRFANAIVYVAGDTISYRQLATMVEKETGETFDREELTPAKLHDALSHNPGPMEKYRAAFGQGDGMHWPKAQTFNAQQGIDTMTVRDWLRAHMSA